MLIPEDPTQYDDESTSPMVRWLHKLQKTLIQMNAPATVDPQDPQAIAAAARVLSKLTSFEPVPRSSIIVVRHTSSSKERSAMILEHLVRICVERHQEIYQAGSQFEANRQLEKSAYEALRGSRRRIASRTTARTCGVDDVGSALVAAQERIKELDEEINRLVQSSGR